MTISGALVNELIQSAKDSSERAYTRYSHFKVGAAVLTRDGSIYTGCNVENASYGLSICAERNAIFQAVAKSKKEMKIKMIVIYTPTDEPTPPCGACRQVINEFGPDAEVVCVCDGSKSERFKLVELLPRAFGPDSL